MLGIVLAIEAVDNLCSYGYGWPCLSPKLWSYARQQALSLRSRTTTTLWQCTKLEQRMIKQLLISHCSTKPHFNKCADCINHSDCRTEKRKQTWSYLFSGSKDVWTEDRLRDQLSLIKHNAACRASYTTRKTCRITTHPLIVVARLMSRYGTNA